MVLVYKVFLVIIQKIKGLKWSCKITRLDTTIDTMGPQLRSPPKPLNTMMQSCSRGFRGTLNWVPAMQRHGKVSDSLTLTTNILFRSDTYLTKIHGKNLKSFSIEFQYFLNLVKSKQNLYFNITFPIDLASNGIFFLGDVSHLRICRPPPLPHQKWPSCHKR